MAGWDRQMKMPAIRTEIEQLQSVLTECEDLVREDNFPNLKRQLTLFMEMVQKHTASAGILADNEDYDALLKGLKEASVSCSEWLDEKKLEMKPLQAVFKLLKDTPFVSSEELNSLLPCDQATKRLVCLAFTLSSDEDAQFSNMQEFLKKREMQKFEETASPLDVTFTIPKDGNQRNEGVKFVATEEPLSCVGYRDSVEPTWDYSAPQQDGKEDKVQSKTDHDERRMSSAECKGANVVALQSYRAQESKGFNFEKVELRKSIKHREKIQNLEELEEEHLTKVGPPLKNFAEDKRFFLGSGSFGTCVYAGILEDGSEVAVKRMVIQVCEGAAENEKKILSLIETKKSPFIVSYRNFVKDNRFMYLIVDICEETLDEHVHSQNIDYLRIHGRRMIREMLTGLKFLHDQGILHRDLKPSNILVDVEGHMRLADFGISRVLKEDETTVYTDEKGTEGWMAVEVIQTIEQIGKGRFKKKFDIQSAGMIAFFILTRGGHPFGCTKYERMANIVAGNPVNLVNLDDLDARQFVSWLISHTIRDRPYADEALLDPFMDNIDYEEESRPTSILFLEEYHN